VSAYTEVEVGEAWGTEMLQAYLCVISITAKAMGVRKVGEQWKLSDLARAAKNRLMVRIRLT